MHSENKECDDSVMSTSSSLQQINEKGEHLVHLQYFKPGIFCLFLCMFACFLQYVVFVHRIKQGTAISNLLPHGEKAEHEPVQMHTLQKGEWRCLVSSLWKIT